MKHGKVINISAFMEDLKNAAIKATRLMRDQVDSDKIKFNKKGVVYEAQLVAETYHILRNEKYEAGFEEGLFLERKYGTLRVDMVFTGSDEKKHLVEFKPIRKLENDKSLKKTDIDNINKDLFKLKELSYNEIVERILIVGFIGDSNECGEQEFDKIVRTAIKAGKVHLITC